MGGRGGRGGRGAQKTPQKGVLSFPSAFSYPIRTTKKKNSATILDFLVQCPLFLRNRDETPTHSYPHALVSKNQGDSNDPPFSGGSNSIGAPLGGLNTLKPKKKKDERRPQKRLAKDRQKLFYFFPKSSARSQTPPPNMRSTAMLTFPCEATSARTQEALSVKPMSFIWVSCATYVSSGFATGGAVDAEGGGVAAVALGVVVFEEGDDDDDAGGAAAQGLFAAPAPPSKVEKSRPPAAGGVPAMIGGGGGKPGRDECGLFLGYMYRYNS